MLEQKTVAFRLNPVFSDIKKRKQTIQNVLKNRIKSV